MSPPIEQLSLTIDGKKTKVAAGTTIWEAARGLGIEIPTLCHSPRMKPAGVCRVCVVDVGERTLAPACMRECAEGMKVDTCSEAVAVHRRRLVALLLSEYPENSVREGSSGDDELLAVARLLKVGELPFPDGADGARGRDASSPVIMVDHQACILCDRCIRACSELQHNNVIGRTGKGYHARISFDLNSPMGESSCVACGECVAVCPTGALTEKALAGISLKIIEAQPKTAETAGTTAGGDSAEKGEN